MVRRLLRSMLWGLRGLLLAVALAALFGWAWSWRHPGFIGAERHYLQPDRVDRRDFAAGWTNGRIAVGRWWWTFAEGLADEGRRQAGSPPPRGWKWDGRPGRWRWMDPAKGSWGPVRWEFYDFSRSDLTNGRLLISFPAWLLAGVAGAWPLASIALLIRRRRRLRWLARVGCCRKCGYDLRATPEESGPLLARCPECGRETQRDEAMQASRATV